MWVSPIQTPSTASFETMNSDAARCVHLSISRCFQCPQRDDRSKSFNPSRKSDFNETERQNAHPSHTCFGTGTRTGSWNDIRELRDHPSHHQTDWHQGLGERCEKNRLPFPLQEAHLFGGSVRVWCMVWSRVNSNFNFRFVCRLTNECERLPAISIIQSNHSYELVKNNLSNIYQIWNFIKLRESVHFVHLQKIKCHPHF